MTESTEQNVFQRYRADNARVADLFGAVVRMQRRRGDLYGTSATPAQAKAAMTEADKQTEDDSYYGRRGARIRACGRHAVGVSLFNGKGQTPPTEKVHHGRCRDKVCPTCSAIRNAHLAPILSDLIRRRLEAGARLYFFTLTVAHKKHHSCESTRAVLDKAWKLAIRRKLWRGTWSERHRVAECELTKDNGFHPHFHGLAELDASSVASHWRNDKLESEMKELWASCTRRAGRESYQVDFRAIVIHARCKETGEVSHVRYWIRPNERAKFEASVKAGNATAYRNKGQVYRVVTLAGFVDELTKYITKRQADGAKTNQISLFDMSPKQFEEYTQAVKGWQLHRSSKGWIEIAKAFEEALNLAREIEEAKAGGAEFLSWGEITDECQLAAKHALTRQQADEFARKYPRILKALEREGCDVSADQIRGYVFRFFGDVGARLHEIKLAPYQRMHAMRNKAERSRRVEAPKSQRTLWAKESRSAILEGA